MFAVGVLTFNIQYRHLIPASMDWTSGSVWLYKHPWITCPKSKPSTSMTHVACESKLRSVVRSSMQPCPGNSRAIGHAVIFYDRAVHTFSAVIKCRHYHQIDQYLRTTVYLRRSFLTQQTQLLKVKYFTKYFSLSRYVQFRQMMCKMQL